MTLKAKLWLPGIAIGLLYAAFDLSFRLLGNDVGKSSDELQMRALEATEVQSAGLTDDQFDQYLGWLAKLKNEREQKEQQKQQAEQARKQSKSESGETDNKAPTVESVDIDERYQVKTSNSVLTLKGIFFDDGYFAVMEQRGANGDVEKIRMDEGERVDELELASISQSTVSLVNTETEVTFKLILFKDKN